MKQIIFLLALIALGISAQAQLTITKGLKVGETTITNNQLTKIPEIDNKSNKADEIKFTTYFGVDSLRFDATKKRWKYLASDHFWRTVAISDSAIVANWSGLKTGLVSAYEFDETSGTSAANAVAGAPAGTFTNGSFAGTTGKIGKCALLDATDDYIDLTNNAIYNLTNNFSISMWFKLNSVAANRYLFTKGGGMYSARINTTAQYRFLASTLTPTAANTTGYFPGTGNWVHVVFTYASGSLKVYENGALKETLPFTGNISTDAFSLKLGRYTGSEIFDGYIDQTLVYSRVLSLSEVQLIYNSGNGREVKYF